MRLYDPNLDMECRIFRIYQLLDAIIFSVAQDADYHRSKNWIPKPFCIAQGRHEKETISCTNICFICVCVYIYLFIYLFIYDFISIVVDPDPEYVHTILIYIYTYIYIYIYIYIYMLKGLQDFAKTKVLKH